MRLTPDSQIAIECPSDINENADCMEVTREVDFDCPVATDLCGIVDFDVATDCTCTVLDGDLTECDPAWLLDLDEDGVCGGEFPQGTYFFDCLATDAECLDTAACDWTVTVSAMTGLDIFVQLSPTMDPGPFTRAIEFQLWEACSPLIVSAPFCREMTFGGVYLDDGKAEEIVKVPKGQWMCLTARDPLHTLRASDFIECEDDGLFHARFHNDPLFGGNWLVGGNLDGLRDPEFGSPRTIDIIDYGVFVSQFLMMVGADTACGDTAAHADINGDGFVDDIDFSFISINFLVGDKDACCPGGRTPIPPGRTSITVRELTQMGLGDLSVSDLNKDGTVDLSDMAAFMAGQRPKASRGSR